MFVQQAQKVHSELVGELVGELTSHTLPLRMINDVTVSVSRVKPNEKNHVSLCP